MKNVAYLRFIAIFFILLFFNSSCEDALIETNAQNSVYFVSPEEAFDIAKKIDWGYSSTKYSKTSYMTIKETFPVIDENSEIVFYIINYEAGGFVILSADKRISPILAYSDKNSFITKNKLYSSGLVDWLVLNKDYVKFIRTKDEVQNPELKEQWENVVIPITSSQKNTNSAKIEISPPTTCENEYEEVLPLLTTEWGQGCGYNDQMPILTCLDQPCIDNSRVFAGCVLVAISQVMRYYSHPVTYSWADMPNEVGTNASAFLIRDLYNAIPTSEKSYDCDGTGVNKSYNIAGLFTGSFNYSSASKADYNYLTVRQQIRLNRPVILSGGRDDGWWIFHSYEDGHMWVCDGLRNSFIWNGDCTARYEYTFFHMNWGWDGNENGWFTHNNFDPNIFTFNYDVEMIYNIVP